MNRVKAKLPLVVLAGCTVIATVLLIMLYEPPITGEGLEERRDLGTESPSSSQRVGPDAVAEEQRTDRSRLDGADEVVTERTPLAPSGRGDLVIHGILELTSGGPPPRPVRLTVTTNAPPFTFQSLRQLTAGTLRYITASEELADAAAGPIVVSDAAGRFKFEGLREGALFIVPLDSIFHSARPAPVKPAPAGADDVTSVRVVLDEGGILEGVVLDSRGRALAGVRLTLRELFDPLLTFSERKGFLSPFSIHSARDGSFRFQAVPLRGNMALDAYLPGYARTQGQKIIITAGTPSRLELVLLDAASICGVVLDGDGKVLPRQQVRLEKTDNVFDSILQDDKNSSNEQVSQEDGHFRFDDLAPGTYRVFLCEPGVVRASLSGLELVGGQALEDLVLVAEKGLSLAGLIVDSRGEPVAGARIKPVPQLSLTKLREYIDDSRFLHVAISGEDGTFECAGLHEGTFNLEIVRGGITDASHKGFRAGQTDLVITLKAGGIAGFVVSTADGETIREFRLQLDPAHHVDIMDPFGFKAKIFRKVTHEQGRFEVFPLQPGRYSLIVQAEGHGHKRIDDITVNDTAITKGIVVMLAPEASVSGAVYDKRTGEPVEGAKVSLKTGLEGMIDEFQGGLMATSDSEGRFTIGRLTAGRVKLYVTHARYRSQPLEALRLLEGERIEDYDLFLSRGGVIEGHVYGVGQRPLGGVSIMASSASGSVLKSAKTDREGFYEMSGFPAGTYTVMQMARNFNLDEGFLDSLTGGFERRQVVLAEDEVARCDFQMQAQNEADALIGRVTEAGSPVAGSPVAGAIINLVCMETDKRSDAGMKTATTNSDGSYRFRDVPAGRYTFRVVKTDNLVYGGGTGVVFTTEIPETRPFAFDMELPGGAIEGRVVDHDDLEPLSGVRILLEDRRAGDHDDPITQATGGRVAEVYSDEQGRFRLSNLREGRYDLIAGGTNLLGMNPGGYARTRMEAIEVRERRAVTGLRVKLEKGGSIEGQVQDRRGDAVAGATLFFQPVGASGFETYSECSSDGSGRFRYAGLAPGRYTVAAKHPGYAVTLLYDVALQKERIREVEVTMEPGASLIVEIRDAATATPVIDARIGLRDGAGRSLTGLFGIDDLMGMLFPGEGGGNSSGSGVYNVGCFAPGVYHLEIQHPDYGTHHQEVQILPDMQDLRVTVRL